MWNSLPLTLWNVGSFSEFKFLIKNLTNKLPPKVMQKLYTQYWLFKCHSLEFEYIYTETVTLDWLDVLFLFFVGDCCQILPVISGRFWRVWLDSVLLEISRRSLVFCWFQENRAFWLICSDSQDVESKIWWLIYIWNYSVYLDPAILVVAF